MLHALRGRAREDRDAGFTLIEILVAMVLMAIVMSSLAVFFIGAQKSSSALRMRQDAAVLGDDAMDQVHSIEIDKLLTNRDKVSSDAQWASPVAGVDLSTMTELYDTTSVPLPANNTGLNDHLTQLPTFPTTESSVVLPLTTPPVSYKVNKTQYTISYYIGLCYVPSGGGACVKVQPTGGVPMDRVVVAVNWHASGANCPGQTCAYVIASLISTTGDPTFNVNEILLDTTPPSTPSNVVCTQPTSAAAGGDIKIGGIGWSAASDASGIGRYDVYRGTSPNFTDPSVQKIGTSTTTMSNFIDTGLVPNTQYWYWVLAVDTVGNVSGAQVPVGTVTNPQQPYEASCSTVPDTVNPVSPASLSGTSPTSSTITLTWPAGTDDYQVDHYQIVRTSPAATYSVPAGTLTFTDTGLLPWTNYTYKIYAVDVAGNVSSTTNPSVTVKTIDTQAPTKPTPLTATAKPWPALEIDLDWPDSSDDVAVTGYTVYRSSTSSTAGFAVIGTPTVSGWADTTGLVTNKQYWYYVTAHDAVPNTSVVSSTVTATTPDTQPPTAPTTLTSPSKTAFTVNLAWSGATDNIGVTSYQVYRNGTLVGTPTSASFVDTGLINLTTYSYTVKAVDAAGNVSPLTSALGVTTLDGTPPTAPTLSNSAVTVTSMTLNWTAASDNVAVTGYALYEDGGTTPIVTTGSSTFSYVDTGEAPGTTHTYVVKAFDAAGNYSVASNTVTATTTADTTAPNKVNPLSGTATGSRAFNLSWTAPTDNVGVTGYKLYLNGTLLTTIAAPTVSQPYSGVANGVYTFTIYAYDAAGNVSLVSNARTATVTNSGVVIS